MKSLRIPSLMLILSLSWSIAAASPQFHSCPPLDDDVGGICSEECPTDGNCPGDQLCCSNGCGHACVDPITIPYHSPPLASCPPVDDDIVGTCDERCTTDADCTNGEMCCSNGCGHVCVAQVSPCSAIFQQISNQSLIGSYLPQCEEDGSFSRAQCHGSTGYCWCVEPERGQPVSDIVRHRMPQCNCTHDGTVHYVGETFAAGDGCNTCSCTLDGQVKCTELAVPCSGQQQFYSCPVVSGDMAGVCVQECSSDSDCPHSKKCCSNGCGFICQAPVAIPYVYLTDDATCPPRNEVPCAKLVGGACRDPAYPCEEGRVCCDNECASAFCLRLADLKLCLKAQQILQGNSTTPLLGAYSPKCDENGQFQELQCHERHCWCVDNVTGRPLSDIVGFEDLGKLKCSGCVYNGKSYNYKDSFPSSDGCNQCTCFGEGIACTKMACGPTPIDDSWLISEGGGDNGLWEWWHTVLIVCASVVGLLGVIVTALCIGVVVLMRQNGQYSHHQLKEIKPEKVDMTGEDVPYQPHSPHEVQFKAGLDSIELKVPVEDTNEHKPAHA